MSKWIWGTNSCFIFESSFLSTTCLFLLRWHMHDCTALCYAGWVKVTHVAPKVEGMTGMSVWSIWMNYGYQCLGQLHGYHADAHTHWGLQPEWMKQARQREQCQCGIGPTVNASGRGSRNFPVTVGTKSLLGRRQIWYCWGQPCQQTRNMASHFPSYLLPRSPDVVTPEKTQHCPYDTGIPLEEWYFLRISTLPLHAAGDTPSE